MRHLAVSALDCILKPWAYEALPLWKSRWWSFDGSFTFAGRDHPLFCHRYNCGWPPGRMTERSAELALADAWLSEDDRDEVYEIGAVTPYYWPGRVRHVVDPYDAHPDVSDRVSLFDISLVGRPVLSISTIEHIGVQEYGHQISDPGQAIEALNKLIQEPARLLLTMPIGYHKPLDRHVFEHHASFRGVETRFLMRGERDNQWAEVGGDQASGASYGPRSYADPGAWANAIVVISR